MQKYHRRWEEVFSRLICRRGTEIQTERGTVLRRCLESPERLMLVQQ